MVYAFIYCVVYLIIALIIIIIACVCVRVCVSDQRTRTTQTDRQATRSCMICEWFLCVRRETFTRIDKSYCAARWLPPRPPLLFASPRMCVSGERRTHLLYTGVHERTSAHGPWQLNVHAARACWGYTSLAETVAANGMPLCLPATCPSSVDCSDNNNKNDYDDGGGNLQKLYTQTWLADKHKK